MPCLFPIRSLALAAWLGGVAAGTTDAIAGEFAFSHENVMGTSLELRVRADDEETARGAEGRVLGEIERLARIFSTYDLTSEFSRWQAAPPEPTPVSPELFAMLQAADDWRARTGGAFDPRVDVFSKLWAACAREDRLPTDGELAEARRFSNREPWRLDPAARTAEPLADGPLSLDAIAKGAIVERACAVAFDPARGVHGVLLNVGGDLRAVGEGTWTVGLAPARGDSETAEPVTFLEVRNRSVATSGDSQRGWRIAGRWYSHILDPRTGRPVDEVIAATVVAPRGADADALATAFNVLPIAESLRLADSLPDVACRIVARDGRIAKSARWERHEPPRPAPRKVALASATTQAVAGWGDAFELAVDFVINQPGGETVPYRRPYVVVWAENEKGQTVRTVSLWVSLGGAGPDQWLPDLRRWYRGDELRSLASKKNMIYTIARPTRPPGAYTVVWDGKDDLGKPLPPGDYTVFIETAREHGTRQLIRARVTLGTEPFTQTLPGNIEIRSATLEYRRKNSG